MKPKHVVPRRVAEDDLERAFNYYLTDAGPGVAEEFVNDFQRTTELIGRSPAAGSPRYGFEAGLGEVRFRLMKRFPYLIFYAEKEHYIDVWRVLHASMEISSRLEKDE